MVEHKLLSSDGQIAARGHGGLQKKKNHRPHVVMKLRLQGPSKPRFSFVSRISRLFCGRDCAKRCVNCAEGSKQLRGHARAQLRGNIGWDPICNVRLPMVGPYMSHEVTNSQDSICNMRLPMVATLHATKDY